MGVDLTASFVARSVREQRSSGQRTAAEKFLLCSCP
jgi:hypothetical protein